jgi:hypothetical protein
LKRTRRTISMLTKAKVAKVRFLCNT